jgi:FkbM family methyltransferase
MKSSASRFAQYTFNAATRLHGLSEHGGRLTSILARLANKVVIPLARASGRKRYVFATVYGQRIAMPAEHPLAATMARYPQYNRPLGLAVEVITASSGSDATLALIDVGANVGDTIAVMEQRCPGRWQYLCIEADETNAELCELNYGGNDCVEIERAFIGEDEGAVVWLQNDGRANPSTKLAVEEKHPSAGAGRLVRLDTLARDFTGKHGLSFIKVDTEGYDFSVLRSGPEILRKYRPALFFEWFPEKLMEAGEQPCDGFEYLKELGYRHFVIFRGKGEYYCNVTDPDRLFLRGLESVALSLEEILYFDIFASTEKELCDRLVESSIAAVS